MLFGDHKFGHVGLLPEEWESAPDLGIRIEVLLAAFASYHDLFNLNEVGYIAILIDSTVEESCAAALSPPSGDKYKLHFAILDRLVINKALDQVRAPWLRDILRLYLRKHVSVPAKILLNVTLSWEAMLLVKSTLTLQIAREVIVVGEEEALR